jgi:hypothetical protein
MSSEFCRTNRGSETFFEKFSSRPDEKTKFGGAICSEFHRLVQGKKKDDRKMGSLGRMGIYYQSIDMPLRQKAFSQSPIAQIEERRFSQYGWI